MSFGETNSYSHCPRCGQSLKGTSGSCWSCSWPAEGQATITSFDGKEVHTEYLHVLKADERAAHAIESALPLLERIAAALEDIAHIHGAIHHGRKDQP